MIAHHLRRAAQTPRAFANWAPLLRDMAAQQVGGGPADLTFRARVGQDISCPNRPGARVPIYEVYAEDTYRLDEFLGPLLGEPLRVLDVGAHVGAFACRLAMLAPEATVECFEPSASTAAYLRRNVEQNALTGRISVDERAISDDEGWATFADNGAGSALNGLVGAGPVTAGVEPEVRVQTTTFDSVVASDPRPVDVVKLDCEGGEYAAVLGSSPDSWAQVRRVVLEYHPSAEHGWPELRDWFAACGLRLVRDAPAAAQQGTAWLGREPAA